MFGWIRRLVRRQVSTEPPPVTPADRARLSRAQEAQRADFDRLRLLRIDAGLPPDRRRIVASGHGNRRAADRS